MKPVKYIAGSPRQIRFDARVGTFSIDGTMPLPYSAKNPLTISPVGYKVFDAALFTKADETPKEQKWLEIFYIDEKNCICAVLFKTISVDNFAKAFANAYYENDTDEALSANQMLIKISPKKMEGKDEQGQKTSYACAEFEITILEEKAVTEKMARVAGLQLYRPETCKVTHLHIAENVADVEIVKLSATVQSADNE